MVATTGLYQAGWAGRLPDVGPGEPFWASSRDTADLLASGQAVIAPAGTPAPPAEPGWTANGSPGFAAGTSNSTCQVPGRYTVDGGPAERSPLVTIDGGPAERVSSGTLDGGNP